MTIFKSVHYQPGTHDHPVKGITLSLLAWFALTCMTALSREAQLTATVPMILLVQNFIGILFTLPYIIRHHKPFSQTTFSLIFTRAITGQLNFAFLLLAIRKISLANALLLNNSAPIIVPLISFLWLRTKIAPKIWIGIIIGFVGILLILQPTHQIINIGASYALIGAVFLSFVMISLRLLANKESPFVILFYFFLIGFIFSVPFCFFYWNSIPLGTIFMLIGIGILMILGQYLLVKSFHYGKATQLAPMCYSAVVYSLFFDWIFWHEVPDYLAIGGIVLVCIGGVFTLLTKETTK